MASSLIKTVLNGRCPHCGDGRLFKSWLEVAPNCSHCGQDFAGHDAGDGPAVFVIFILGFFAVIMAVVIDQKFSPPYWLEVAIWVPVILGMTLGMLRPTKALLIALKYRHNASGDLNR